MTKENSYGFDGTISQYPYQYTQDISFIRKNIHDHNDDENTNLSFLTDQYKDIFLKIDIEGGEYPWLLHLENSQLENFKQIVIEFHGLTDDGWGATQEVKTRCLEKLSKTHYIVHAHGNNYGISVNYIPDVLELTYVNKKCFDSIPERNEIPFPTLLDFPNDPYQQEISLKVYPFVKA